MPDPDGLFDGPLPASKTSLLEVLEDVGTKTIHYIYDFGDDWHHVVKVEKIEGATPGTEYPRLVRAIGACPPEDVGGARGYARFLEAIVDPAHEDHAEVSEWHGETFDREDAGVDRILEGFERLSRKWAPRPRKSRAPTGRS